MLGITLLILAVCSLTSSQITSYQRPDGSYSIGHSSVSHGDTGEALEALLTYASGWTNEDEDYADVSSLYPIVQTKEARSAFRQAMDTLVTNIHRILNQNNEVIGVFQRVGLIIINYFRYIGNIAANQISSWISSRPSGQRRISYSSNLNRRSSFRPK